MNIDRAWTSRVVRPRKLSASEIELWTSCCRNDPSLGHPFFAFGFVRAVDHVYPHVFVAVLEKRGRTVGFLPFQFSSWPARLIGAAERVGGTVADRFGVIAGESLGLAPDELLRLAGLNSLAYSFLPTEQLGHGFPGQRAVAGQHVVLSGDAQSYWAALKSKSRKFASNVERNERLLAKEFGPLKMTLRADPARELQRLIDVKAAQYLRTEGVNPLRERWRTDFLREILRSTDPQCTAALSTLYAGDTWLASHLGIMSPMVSHYWYPVYNPDYARFSPGHVLTKHLILAAVSAGIHYFDMGGFGHYKDHFRPESYEYHAGFWRSVGVGGLVNQIATSLEWRVERVRARRRKRLAQAAHQSADPTAQ